jgi:hypothetical protein
MISDSLAQLRTLLHPEGGFTSHVTSRRGREIDRNGFVAAMVLRLLRHLPDTPCWIDIRNRLLDWLWNCRSTLVPGAFAFWPDQTRPNWASRMPADVDDTAVMLTELLRYRRLDRLAVLRSFCSAVVPNRVTDTDATMLPPWVVPGSFFTWITPVASASPPRKRWTNVVDCCVNTNVIALMSQLQAQHLPGFQAAVQTVLNGLEWAGDDARRLTSIMPFYPSVRSLGEAMQHAVECGAGSLGEGLKGLRSIAPDVRDTNTGFCGSAYGHVVWHAPAIDLARAIANRLTCERR